MNKWFWMSVVSLGLMMPAAQAAMIKSDFDCYVAEHQVGETLDDG